MTYPRVENQPHMLQTVLSLVEAEQGVSIVPACARNLRSNGVRFYRLQPDDVRVELVAAWETATRPLSFAPFWIPTLDTFRTLRRENHPGRTGSPD